MTPVEISSQPDPSTILVIDDDPLVSVVVRRAMEGVRHRLHSAADGESGIRSLTANNPDVVVLDNILPDCLGVDALTKIHELAPEVPIVFVTARGTGGTAIEAMKLSAFDYLPKPIEPPKLRSVIDRALELRRLTAQSPEAPEVLYSESQRELLVGECPSMQAVFKSIGKVASQDVTVLVRGEHGTGKETVAREIHGHSGRAAGPFVTLHCRGLDERVLEQELFGIEGGWEGKTDQASGGTLVLQEVAGLPLPLQSKLLTAIRDGHYEKAGGSLPAEVRCRFVAISSEDLEEKTRAGHFRSDLFYTLSSFVIALPPLRQRHGDMPLLIRRGLQRLAPIAGRFGVEHPRVSESAMKALSRHLWPGNLDELESVLKRALVEQKGNVLLANSLFGASPESVVPSSESSGESRYATDWTAFAQMRIEAGSDTLHADAVEEAERKLFARVLRHTRGNQAQASRILGITRASLRKKLRLYGMAARSIAEDE